LPFTQENRHGISGAVCCLVAALAYTAANICMRQLTTLRCDPFWAIFGRELVTVLLAGSWVAYRAMRGWPTLPSGRTLHRILLVGVLIEVFGNVCVQWALGVVGLAVTVPAIFAVSITSGAILGRAVLGERVSIRSAAAIALLLVSLGLLAVGAEGVGPSIAGNRPDFRISEDGTFPLGVGSAAVIVLGVAAAGLAGGVYSLMNVVIRHSVTRTTLPCAVALLIPLMGVVSLGPIALVRSGVPALSSGSVEEILLMAAAGVFNLIGFLGFIYGLQRTTVVYANTVNASQVAMAAVAGMAIFAEAPNPWLVAGVVLTIIGIAWIDRPADAFDDIPPP
jgi:drug/metabolite transporter, DME family